MASVANRAHCRRNPRAKKEKGQSRRELSERLDVGRPEMFGGLLVPNISGIDGQRLWAATKAPQRAKGRAVPDGCRTVGIVGGGS